MGLGTDCEHFIPLAARDVVELICADRSLAEEERGGLRLLAEQIIWAHHRDYHGRLQQLKRAYAPFDPDASEMSLVPLTSAERQERLNALYSSFTWLLEHAHFTHLSREEIEQALDYVSDWGIRMDVDFSAFEHVAIFVRGAALQKRTRSRLTGFYRTEEVEVPIYHRLVLILKLRPHPRLQGPIDTANVHLKLFKDIPRLDIDMLLPGARVRLSRLDRSRIGLPLLSGTALAVWNVLQDLTVTLETLFSSPNALWGLAAGGLGYGYRSFHGYRSLKQQYHLTLSQSLYFQNLDNNAGVLTRLLDEAEEQQNRLAILAYHCLQYFGATGMTAADLDASVELYLDRYADVTVSCLPGAALRLLQHLGIVQQNGERWQALPLPAARAAVQSSGGPMSSPIPTVAVDRPS